MSTHRRVSDQENTDRWLLTYADLLTLLLGFFVIMYSMSRIDAKRFGKMTEGLHGVFHGGQSVLNKDAEQDDMGAGVLKIGKLKMIQQRIKRLSNYVGRENVSLTGGPPGSGSTANGSEAIDKISAEINERGLVIHILESALFESASSELLPSARDLLDKVAAELSGLPNHIRIEGHTDSRPISTYRFPSNWELSAARASSVVRYFIEKHNMPPDRISALGFGEHRPLASNSTARGMAQNRRVDIVVLTEDLSELEPRANGDDSVSVVAQE
jgi:chemotaxis protein MotB